MTVAIVKPPGRRASFTHKQMIICTILFKKNPDGTNLDMDQLLAALPYKVTKHALHFCLRALIKHGMIERLKEPRRGAIRAVLRITEAGENYMTTSTKESKERAAESGVISPAVSTEVEELSAIFGPSYS